ncbi:MAG: hypothetical protein GF329_15950 [Candidatus Lokiarchaeota archaeon]|nr:hypothetical protein [Candidatus Lokiarchaeota archaeon]
MADLEGLSRKLIEKKYSNDDILNKLIDVYLIYKDITKSDAIGLAEAVLEEVKNSSKEAQDQFTRLLLNYPKSNVSIGEQGVGCRGWGDFFVHNLLAKLSETSTKAYLAPDSLDDAGAVVLRKRDQNNKIYITSKMEGMHSRLSDFPFIAGFHVTRAALRDLYVKGSDPISIMIDIHLGDDTDIGKLFDFMGGVSAVAELTKIPITAGSTLRIGGDMVIGTRITGGIGAVGITKKVLARRNISRNDIILMTEGSGGGTIATTAIYSGNPDVVKETMNIKFLSASQAILENELLNEINCMCDVTNGGIRGDLNEIAQEANIGISIEEEKFRSLVNPKVNNLLKSCNVDYLGVSLDALLIFCPKSSVKRILNVVSKAGVKIDIIGRTNDKGNIKLKTKDGEIKLLTKYRESAYTKVKQVIGEEINEKQKNLLAKRIEDNANKVLKKRDKIINWIKDNQN